MITFLAIAAGCGIFFLFSLFFGGDGDGDVDFGHGDVDAGGMDHDVDGGHGSGPSVFSIRTVMLFGVGFGAAGAIAKHSGYTVIGASLWGALLGVVMATIGYFFIVALMSQQSSTISNPKKLIGKNGRITVAITESSLGEIETVDEHGTGTTLLARSENGTSINAGAAISIVDVVGSQAIVKIQAPSH